uniref:Regulator of G protein signaling 14 n=1 Tax=Anolis carolinensis TaxID=28377 RepID=G1KFE4_ANOCA|nr:PREDICTED: regulator of G-protein signaling 14 isoform X1 [Anolis carolinensis]|eukprot:XP_008103184.1 PREDICTED: regulator of G-protein signaling 14 isoform X1 [Anolis carolinensis]
MPGKPKHLGVPNGRMGLAASDGELNSSGVRGSNDSVVSLPNTQSISHSLGHSVARWAESFETLLQDRLGVAYFTEFLKKEFSAENVYFWQACERFQQIPASCTEQLSQEARKIYNEFLSSHSVNPVNIDRQAWIGEEMLATPTPDMFNVQQLQIFNLMKFDSYARFVKSPQYQACAKAESQGQPLPELRPHSQCGSPPADLGKKTKLKPGKSLPLGVEAVSNVPSRSPRRSFRKGEHSRREERNGSEGPSHWRESQGSLNSSASLDLGFLSSYATSGSQSENHRKSLTGPESENQNQPIKYCCVYLPDGTASLAPVRSGLSIQDMLSGICQRRGLHLPDVKIYLVGNEKKPLALNQESLVLVDQEVKLETRISFELELIPINKKVRILAKSTKNLQEALQPILEKYGLDVRRVLLRRPGEPHALNMEEKVSAVSAQRLVLESDEEVKPVGVGNASANLSCEQSEDDSCAEMESESEPFPEMSTSFARPARSNQNRRTYDLEGLVDLLNRVQSTRVDDQRGLLSKEDLVLPDFLQKPEQDSCKKHSLPSPAPDKKHTPEATTCQAQEQLPQPQAAPPPKLQTRSLSTSSAYGKPSAI